jgi:hypothetical protein
VSSRTKNIPICNFDNITLKQTFFLKKYYKGLTLIKINRDKKRYISPYHIISKVVMSYDFIQKNRYTKDIYEYQTKIHISYILQDHTQKNIMITK